MASVILQFAPVQILVCLGSLGAAEAEGSCPVLQDTLEMCSQEKEFRSILFALCYFHAVVSERRKFGAQGWNRPYPFSTGDLTISVNVLYNYLEASSKVRTPWVGGWGGRGGCLPQSHQGGLKLS